MPCHRALCESGPRSRLAEVPALLGLRRDTSALPLPLRAWAAWCRHGYGRWSDIILDDSLGLEAPARRELDLPLKPMVKGFAEEPGGEAVAAGAGGPGCAQAPREPWTCPPSRWTSARQHGRRSSGAL